MTKNTTAKLEIDLLHLKQSLVVSEEAIEKLEEAVQQLRKDNDEKEKTILALESECNLFVKDIIKLEGKQYGQE